MANPSPRLSDMDPYRLLVFELLRREPRARLAAHVQGVAHSSDGILVLTPSDSPGLANQIRDRFGIDVSVRAIGPVELAVRGGDSVGAATGRQVTGTLGCLVKDAAGTSFGLTCDHVVGATGGQSAGDDVWAPGKADGGTAAGTIGSFERGSTIVVGGTAANRTDAALVRFAPGASTAAALHSIGTLKGFATMLAYGAPIRKYGRVTKLTHGTFVYTVSLLVPYPGGSALFVDQLGIDGHPGTLFADQGDSGAVVVDAHDHAAGLLFAVATQSNLAFANPISEVSSDLGVRL